MLNVFKKIVGTKNERELKRMWPIVEQINQLETQMTALSDDGLRAKTAEFRQHIREQTAAERNRLEELYAQQQQPEDPSSSETTRGEGSNDDKDLRTQIEEQEKALWEAE